MRHPVLMVLLAMCVTLTAGPVLATGLVCGQVVDQVTGQPVAGAFVTSGAFQTRSGADGSFAVEEGEALVRVRAPGYRRAQAPAQGGARIALTPFTPRGVYLSFYGVGEPVLRDPVLKLIEQSELNALVIDFKGDRGMVPHRSEVALTKEIGARRITTVRDMPALIADFKERGIYTIARIVVFKDDLLAQARPDLAVRDRRGQVYRDGEKLAWVDPFQPQVWDYNIALAEEAARLGFDEVQFDYVRFPAVAEPLAFARTNTEDNRVQAISSFLAAARARLDRYNVFLSADIFGYVCWNENDTAIGQRLEDLVPHLDYLSPMLYPSGFSHGVGKYRDPVKNSFEVVALSLQQAQKRTGLPGVRFRPWLQAFRDYAFDRRHFREDEIRAQTRASEETGSNGWMLWNPRNVYQRDGLKVYEAKLQTEPETVVQ